MHCSGYCFDCTDTTHERGGSGRSCKLILNCDETFEHVPCFCCCRRSFAFSHSSNRRGQQQSAEDIETGQVPAITASAAANHSNDDCAIRDSGLTSASSAPTALERQSVQSNGGSPIPASPSQLQTRSSTLSSCAISPGASPSAQVTSAGVLSKLLSVGGRSLKRSPSGNSPVCLICLENLTHEDFEVSCMFSTALHQNSSFKSSNFASNTQLFYAS